MVKEKVDAENSAYVDGERKRQRQRRQRQRRSILLVILIGTKRKSVFRCMRVHERAKYTPLSRERTQLNYVFV